MLTVFTVAGCGIPNNDASTSRKHLMDQAMPDQNENKSLPISFSPPGIKPLTNIDIADDSYGSESIVIQGVLSGESQGGWGGENDDYEVHCFDFVAWKRQDGEVVDRKLTILRAVPPEFDYWDDFPEYSIQKISVLLSSNESRAVFEKALPLEERDDELHAISENLQNPISIETKRFGTLKLDRRTGQFWGETKWKKKPIRITFDSENDGVNKRSLATAETLWASQAKSNNRIEALAVSELLELKNGTWLKQGESEITAKQFVAAMSLTSVSVNSEGGFTFWYDDGELFWGHLIMVHGNSKEGPTDASIQG